MSLDSILSRKRLLIIGLALITLIVCYRTAILGSLRTADFRRVSLSQYRDSSEKNTHANTSSVSQHATSSKVAVPTKPTPQSPQPQKLEDPPKNLDGDFYDSMTTAQCNHHFPKLYKDIDDRVAFWKERDHTINEDDLNIAWRNRTQWGGGAMRILIHDNQIRVTESIATFGMFQGYHERGIAVLALIQQALASAIAAGELLPTVEVAIVVDDIAHPPNMHQNHSFWAFAAIKGAPEHQRRWLIPNFNSLFAMPLSTLQDQRRKAIQHDAPFAQKIQQMVWRGTPALNPNIRETLLNATRGKNWADVKGVYNQPSQRYKLTADEYCRYAMTIHTEGISYSGRLHDLLLCNSLVFSHNLTWFEHWQHLLQDKGPEQNYVQVDQNWEDLEDRVKYFINNPKKADKIINNSINTFRNKYLTQAATSCYIRALIKGYASVSFQPEVYQPLQDDMIRRLRGMPYEIFGHFPRDLNETLLRQWELDELRY